MQFIFNVENKIKAHDIFNFKVYINKATLEDKYS